MWWSGTIHFSIFCYAINVYKRQNQLLEAKLAVLGSIEKKGRNMITFDALSVLRLLKILTGIEFCVDISQ